MFVSNLRLVNFRSYCDATVSFGAGLNVVVGQNAAGKTNLLEGAWFALRGSSPRTRREEKLITWGERFTRVELELDGPAAGPQAVEVAYAPGQGKRARWNGVEVASQDELRGRTQVFIFVPESLLLVKGSPARRRAHLDAFAAALDRAVRGRRARAAGRRFDSATPNCSRSSTAPPASTLDPGTRSSRAPPPRLGRRRRDLVAELSGRFAAAAAGLAPEGNCFTLRLVSQLAGVDYDEDALLDGAARPQARRDGARPLPFGPHRDDLQFLEVGADRARRARRATRPRVAAAGARCAAAAAAGPACGPVALPRGGRDLRLFGSQGEQRAAVLALLLAEQQLAAARTGEQGTLFLDDVMSELDDARRRLLVRQLTSAGQAIITTTDRHYFVEEELDHATVIELPLSGSLAAGAASPPAVAAGAGAAARGRAVERAREAAQRLGDILSTALGRMATSDQARAYAAWARAAGEQVASGARPRHFSRGVLTVECTSSVWANELTYLGGQILRRMDEVAPGHPVKRFRFVIERAAPRQEEEPPEATAGNALKGPRRRISAGRGRRRRECVTSGSGRPSRPPCARHPESPRRLPAAAPREVDKNRRFAALLYRPQVRSEPSRLIYLRRQFGPAFPTRIPPLGTLRG